MSCFIRHAIWLILSCALFGCASSVKMQAPSRDSVDLTAKRERIVYNALFSPQVGLVGTRPVLRAAQVTVLRFGLGPRLAGSILVGHDPGLLILNSKTNLPLTVIALCDFCDGVPSQMQNMVFRPSEGKSDIIEFSLTPKRSTSEKNSYDGKIILLIQNNTNGREYDRLKIDVTITQGSQAAFDDNSTPVMHSIGGVQRESDSNVDAVLNVVQNERKGVILSINPLDAKLRQQIASLVLNTDGSPRIFRTSVFDEKDIEQLTGVAFAELSSVSLQGALANEMRLSGGGAIISAASQKSLKLTEQEKSAVVKVFGKYGRRLYMSLFLQSPDKTEREALKGAIEALEHAAADSTRNRPFRLKIVTDRLKLPWQYIHPTGDDNSLDPEKFWGLRFSLSVIREDFDVPTVLPSKEGASRTVFARYSVSTDESWYFAEEQIKMLKSIPVVDLQEVASRDDLLKKALVNDRNKVAALIAFLHATSGQTVIAGKSSTAVSMNADGPLMYFSDSNFVRADALYDLQSQLSPSEIINNPRYFGGGPLAILNACETGASTIEVQHVTLSRAMFSLGVQGVLVTEVSVWTKLGHEISMRLFTHLGNGESASDALTLVRREINSKFNNPLGLLYAYYGDPSAILKR